MSSPVHNVVILSSERLMIFIFVVLKVIKHVPGPHIDLRHSELLSDFQHKFMLYWTLKRTSFAVEYLLKIKRMIIEEPDIYNLNIDSWIRNNAEEISDHLTSQLLKRLDNDQQIGSILDHLISIGHLNKVLARVLEKNTEYSSISETKISYRPSKPIYPLEHLGWTVYSGISLRFSSHPIGLV